MKNVENQEKQRVKINKRTALMLSIVTSLLIVVTIILAGCKWLKKDEPIEDQLRETLQAVLVDAMSENEESSELLTETESRSGYEIISHSETESGATVTVRVYSPDLYSVAKELDENCVFDTEEELQNAVIEAIGKADIVEQEVTIEYIKTENGYEPILTIEFFDAYYGGVIKLLDEALSKMNEEAAQ